MSGTRVISRCGSECKTEPITSAFPGRRWVFQGEVVVLNEIHTRAQKRNDKSKVAVGSFPRSEGSGCLFSVFSNRFPLLFSLPIERQNKPDSEFSAGPTHATSAITHRLHCGT